MTPIIRRAVTSGAAVLLTFSMTASASPAPDQWYIKMLALVEQGEQVFIDDRSGIFGRMSDAEFGLDRHDIPTFGDASGYPLAIVFSLPEAQGSQFVSNYQEAGTRRTSWDFTIFSSLPTGQVTLAWEGVYIITGEPGARQTALDPNNALFKKLSLVDLETGQVVAVGGKKGVDQYTFNMDGKAARNFRWVQGKVKKSDLVLKPALDAAPAAQAISVQSRSGVLPPPPMLPPASRGAGVITSRPVEREE